MSAYQVRTHFARSATFSWSSSTGTIYPAIRRLREARLLTAAGPTGPRRAELLSTTQEGVSAVRDWLWENRPEVSSSPADPIRTRVQFLAVLTRDQQLQVLADYEAATKVAIANLRGLIGEREPMEQFEQLGSTGSLMQLQARLAWLEIAKKTITERD